jgi:hypothetical protein
MPLIGDLTRPENYAELDQRRSLLQKINAQGGCAFCTHRDQAVMAWGRSICTTPKRSWPTCTQDKRAPAFNLDPHQVGGAS